MANWERVTTTTIREYTYEEEPRIFRNRPVWKKVNSQGNVRTGCSGLDFDWGVKYRQHRALAGSGFESQTYTQKSRHLRPSLPFDRFYSANDAMKKAEFLKNRGKQALIKIAQQVSKNLLDDMSLALSEDLFCDGNLAANNLKFMGLETLFGNAGQSVTFDAAGAVARTADVRDPFYYPSGSYAGVSYTLGARGGAQLEGTWPAGKADTHFDFWTALQCNYRSSYFGGSQPTWKSNCIEAMRRAATHAKRNNAERDGAPDMVVMTRDMLADFKDRQEAKEKTIVVSNLQERAYGEMDETEFDGMTLTTDYGVPDGCAYGMRTEWIRLLSMQDRLIVVADEEYDKTDREYRWSADCFGNFQFLRTNMFFKLLAGVAA